MNKCENCKHYYHSPNILGGVAECTMDIKPIMSMWPNDACGIFSLTDDDKLKDQRECYAKAIPSDNKLCTNQK
jgi:hypothetical protein